MISIAGTYSRLTIAGTYSRLTKQGICLPILKNKEIHNTVTINVSVCLVGQATTLTEMALDFLKILD